MLRRIGIAALVFAALPAIAIVPAAAADTRTPSDGTMLAGPDASEVSTSRPERLRHYPRQTMAEAILARRFVFGAAGVLGVIGLISVLIGNLVGVDVHGSVARRVRWMRRLASRRMRAPEQPFGAAPVGPGKPRFGRATFLALAAPSVFVAAAACLSHALASGSDVAVAVSLLAGPVSVAALAVAVALAGAAARHWRRTAAGRSATQP